MRKKLAVSVLVSLVSVVVLAQNVHFVRGPVAEDRGTRLLFSGKIAGLGEGDVTILVNATGLATVICTNPAGNVAPGQNTTINASGSATLPSPKNGNLVFDVFTLEPTIPDSACPNPQWTPTATDVAFSNATIEVQQGGQTVLGPTPVTIK